jgi:hypothetical protein
VTGRPTAAQFPVRMTFLKGHCAGTSFVLLPSHGWQTDWHRLAVWACDRDRGIGADAMLVFTVGAGGGHAAPRSATFVKRGRRTSGVVGGELAGVVPKPMVWRGH